MVDVLLETAVSNWEPRFTANGVDASDFARITKGLERWDDWCAAWCEGASEHLALGEDALSEGRHRTAGEFFARAATYFHFAKFLFVHDHPAVILIPGLDSTKEEFRDVERSFLDRGMATFAIDGPGQGEAEWTLPIRPEWNEVGEALINHLHQMDQVDNERIGVWGVSLGGFYAARLASSDLPIRGTVALAGPYSLGAAWKGLNPLTRRAFEVRSFSSSPEEAEKRAWEMTLDGHASKITTPLLVIMGKRDRLFPWQDGERLCREARGESKLLLLDEGNHGCANVIYRHRPLAADWMASHLEIESN
jgi:2,6-dihydroxypseudooxynicotine hydrolase